jgi:hypothetical protein
MPHARFRRALIFVVAACLTTPAAFAQSRDDVDRQLINCCAVEADIRGMPAVNYDLMLQEMLTKTPDKVNQVIYWGRPLDWHNQRVA